jgi:hypothetical protein
LFILTTLLVFIPEGFFWQNYNFHNAWLLALRFYLYSYDLQNQSQWNFSVLFFLFAFSISQAQIIQSPSGKIDVNFKLSVNGQPSYSVNYKDKAVILKVLGNKLKEKPALDANFEIITSKQPLSMNPGIQFWENNPR